MQRRGTVRQTRTALTVTWQVIVAFVADHANLQPLLQMETFRRCWKAHGNEERTSSKDADNTARR